MLPHSMAAAEIYSLVANVGWANNVGGKAYDEITPEVWDGMMAINVRGTWLTSAPRGAHARWRYDRHRVIRRHVLGRATPSRRAS